MTTTTMTIKEALQVQPEELATMTLEEVQTVADTLERSTAKQARLKLDVVKGTLEARRKEAKKAGNEEEAKEVQAVENSVKKKVAKKAKPKLKAPKQEAMELEEEEEEGQAEEPKEEPKPKKAPKPKKKEDEAEAGEDEELKAIKKKMAELEKENAKLKAEVFPNRLERKGKAPLVAQTFKKVQDVQKVLVERPLELMIYAHEGIDDKPTAFIVLYMNEEILVLLDRSREANTTLTLDTKSVTEKSLKINNRECPYVYYLAEKK